MGVSYKKEDITKQNVVIGQQNFAWWLGHSSEKGVSNHQKENHRASWPWVVQWLIRPIETPFYLSCAKCELDLLLCIHIIYIYSVYVYTLSIYILSIYIVYIYIVYIHILSIYIYIVDIHILSIYIYTVYIHILSIYIYIVYI